MTPSPHVAGSVDPVPSHARVLLVLLIVATAGSTVYLLPSGGPQPADGLVLLLALWMFARVSRPEVRFLARPLLVMGLFVLWVAARNLVASYGAEPIVFLKRTAQVGYVAFVFAAFALALRRVGTAGLTRPLVRWGLPIIALAPLIAPSGARYEGWRQTLSLNNPNQLAYLALLLLSTVLLLVAEWVHRRGGGRPPAVDLAAGILVLALVHLYLLVASSTTGFVALAVGDLALAGMLVPAVASRRFGGLVLALGFAIALVGLALTTQTAVWETVEGTRSWTRIEEQGFAESLYRRTLNRSGPITGAMLAVGTPRPTDGVTLEVHNTLWQLMANYGLPAVALFVALIWQVVKGALHRSPWHAAALLPAVLYHFAHYGLRFRPFWILLAVVWTLPSLSPDDSGGDAAGLFSRSEGATPRRE
jgi:hypothetical protein